MNPPDISNDYIFREILLASVESAPNIGEDIILDDEMLATVRGGGRVNFAAYVIATLAEAVSSSGADMGIAYHLALSMTAALAKHLDGTLNLTVGGVLAAVLSGRARRSGNMILADALAAKLSRGCKLGADYHLEEMEGYEIMNGRTGTTQYETEYMTVEIEIPAGSELVIDAENFTVTLDGENVLFAVSGEFPVIDRKTAEIRFTFPTNGDFSAYLSYRERFL